MDRAGVPGPHLLARAPVRHRPDRGDPAHHPLKGGTGMFGYLLADAALAGVVFWLCWRYRRFPRLVAVAAPVGAFFTVMAFPAVHAALASSAATRQGMLVLVVLAGAGTLI